jgi:hypothetical protein
LYDKVGILPVERQEEYLDKTLYVRIPYEEDIPLKHLWESVSAITGCKRLKQRQKRRRELVVKLENSEQFEKLLKSKLEVADQLLTLERFNMEQTYTYSVQVFDLNIDSIFVAAQAKAALAGRARVFDTSQAQVRLESGAVVDMPTFYLKVATRENAPEAFNIATVLGRIPMGSDKTDHIVKDYPM